MERILSLALLAALVLAPSLVRAQTYVLTDLGAGLKGATVAVDISSNGHITGAGPGGASGSACTWQPSGAITMFQSLGLPTGAKYSNGWGINDSGRVAGTAGSGLSWENGYLWSSGVWTDMTNKNNQSEALAINSAGTVAGGTASNAAFWKGGKLYTIPNIGPPAIGINDNGQIVGSGCFLWTPNVPNGTTGTTIHLGSGNGDALGINNAGDVVGYLGVKDATGRSKNQAFCFSQTTQSITYLGTLQPDPNHPGYFLGTSFARKINAFGLVVGTSDTAGGVTHGFLWDSVNGLRDLNDTSKVTILGIPAGQTWVFTCPSASLLLARYLPQISINDNGQICGTATVTINGVATSHAFLLTPQ